MGGHAAAGHVMVHALDGHALVIHALIHAAHSPVMHLKHVCQPAIIRALLPVFHVRARDTRVMQHHARAHVLPAISPHALIPVSTRVMILPALIRASTHADTRVKNRVYHKQTAIRYSQSSLFFF